MQQMPIKDQCQLNVKFGIVILYTSLVSMTLQMENAHDRENALLGSFITEQKIWDK